MSRPTFLCASRVAAALCLSGLLAACGDDLEPTPGEDLDPTDGTHISHVSNADGSITTTVNATDSSVWIGLDLDEGAQVPPETDALWDLSFNRYHIRSRGGVNGTGGVEVAVVSGQDFAGLTQAPASGYAVDQDDGDDEGSDPDTVFEANGAWYSYDVSTHKLTPRAQVYVVRTDSGAYVKVKMESYYDDAGTPAMLKLRWSKLTAPTGGAAVDDVPSEEVSAEASR
ncbi:HmuY family protein [Myxococcus fulvus]|uniref:HmuY family protein n=1 Tax=Myxococcus fulvus TaxID=33 RepID=UPI0020BF2BE5|nr:HmuY family protein [Myxococcus fulvus]MCK8497547.1 HmuY family protein [Myxococcus fulvus]